LTTRSWFVTGASSGLGRAIVTALLARGDTVAATSRDPRALAGLAAPAGQPLWTGQLDLTDPAAVTTVVDRAFADLGRIDVIVSNAGYGLFGAAEEVTDEQLRRQIDTNLTGPIRLARAALPHLRAQGGGRIIQLSSVGGQCTVPGMAVYHATKWGVEGFFETLAAEVTGFGIEVTLVEPGSVRTGFTGHGRDLAPPLPAYAHGPVGRLRAAIENDAVRYPGDLRKMAQAIIDSAATRPAPLRLALGSDAYRLIRTALRRRLRDLDAQADLARSTDAADPARADTRGLASNGWQTRE
jgi:NAD(P)-dependent dehydrogenase (short-subunit alcohol dehydrogenase family)